MSPFQDPTLITVDTNETNEAGHFQQSLPTHAVTSTFPQDLKPPKQPQQMAHGPLPLQTTSLQQQQQQQLLLAAMAQQNIALALQQQPNMAVLALQQALTGRGMSHNLIPEHLQATALAASLNGTPGHPLALILPQLLTPSPSTLVMPPPGTQPLTVQDRPLVPPVYNGVNINYPGVRLVNATPPVYIVENFLTPFECDFLAAAANDSWSPAPVVGKGAGEISTSRTSSTCYLAREDLPDYMRKVSLLTGKPVEHCELPQVGRYLHTQQYLQVSLTV